MSQPLTALVTGASSGIGLELARVFAAHGHRLVLLARNRDALEAVARDLSDSAGTTPQIIVADLADPRSPESVARELARRSISIDVLVNDAGFGAYGPFQDADLQRNLDMIQVNVSSLIALTRLLLPAMMERGSGRILNVASTAAFVAGPYMSTYYATKAFVLSHSLALSHELRHKGITVTCLCPGPTRTAFRSRAGLDRSQLFRLKVMDASSVARAGYRGMMRGRRLVIPGFTNKLVVAASRLAPRNLLARIAGRLNKAD